MQWSKLKTTVESFLCENLKGRVQIYATVYRKLHDGPSRVWITFDKKEIVSSADTTYWLLHNKLYQQIIKERELKPIPYHSDWKVMFQSIEREQLITASNEVEERLIEQNIMESHYFYHSLLDYCSLSIDQALKSENKVVRAFAMFDRRLGKRKLRKLKIPNNEQLIYEFYKIRCLVENIAFTETNLLIE